MTVLEPKMGRKWTKNQFSPPQKKPTEFRFLEPKMGPKCKFFKEKKILPGPLKCQISMENNNRSSSIT